MEYDGLPLAFYGDLAKQAWDEMRHAVCYLEAALELLPELEASLSDSDPLLADLAAFRRHGSGLPIPVERNLYEAIWNATLIERLVLFQLDTEGPGSIRKARKMRTRTYDSHPKLARAIEYDLRDEMAHVRLGRKWLKHLAPMPRPGVRQSVPGSSSAACSS